ncbi:hypothetical protein NQ318_010045 [Aromia moschata]|uniref:Uncharacterized protein n=1 Tax=Aromia moschata TaxID=1265417 RepID=A0AAV8YA96_9CUCU|nr:hypothetical protein NQ318_010045 [Aromia moschata]
MKSINQIVIKLQGHPIIQSVMLQLRSLLQKRCGSTFNALAVYNLYKNIWNMAISKNGLKINSKKTKGKYIEQVNSYKYLGVAFEEDGKMDCELNKRIGQANRTLVLVNI